MTGALVCAWVSSDHARVERLENRNSLHLSTVPRKAKVVFI